MSWRRGVVDIFVTWTPTATKSRRRCVRNVNGRTPCIRTHPGLGAIIGGPRMWERGRGDVDFLEVRVGTGVQHAPDSASSVTWPDISSDEELSP